MKMALLDMIGLAINNLQGKQNSAVIIHNILTLVLLNLDIPCICKQCRSRSVVIKYMNFYQQHWSNNLIGWQLEVGVAS